MSQQVIITAYQQVQKHDCEQQPSGNEHIWNAIHCKTDKPATFLAYLHTTISTAKYAWAIDCKAKTSKISSLSDQQLYTLAKNFCSN